MRSGGKFCVVGSGLGRNAFPNVGPGGATRQSTAPRERPADSQGGIGKA
jgi:hypothetical protein